jgi:hypothetical protein
MLDNNHATSGTAPNMMLREEIYVHIHSYTLNTVNVLIIKKLQL